MELHDQLVLYAPPLTSWTEDGLHFFLDPEGPNWVATDDRGAQLLHWCDGATTFGALVRRYQSATGFHQTKAWVHVHDFVQHTLRQQLVAPAPHTPPAYAGRAGHLALERLEECWIHINDACNLACRHCLVSSSPKGGTGLPPAILRGLVDQAAVLGVERFYITGGEPFLRADLPDLLRRITIDHGAELIVLSNALFFDDDRFAPLADLPRDRLKIQISVDGATAATNDFFRGSGTFHRILEGARVAARAGFRTAITTVVTNYNLDELHALPRLARETGAGSFHLMWPHRRGRILVGRDGFFPETVALLPLIDQVREATVAAGVAFDNWDSLALRVNGLPFIKYDLSNASWGSLCIGPTGHVYPAPALSNDPRFDAGDAVQSSLEQVWRSSPLLGHLRNASLVHMHSLAQDPFRFITGGGDLDHILQLHPRFPSVLQGIELTPNQRVVDLSANITTDLSTDPYYPIYIHLVRRIMHDLAQRGRATLNPRSGYSAPPLFHAMGIGAIPAGQVRALPSPDTITLGTLHSNCVLSFDVEQPRKVVRQFYGAAAETPQADLCCPVQYDAAETAHIPAEVLERFYGCGSPSTLAALQPGETYVDLGSGGGIDCFIAAKKVGAAGHVIGIDMTDQMLAVAHRNKVLVADALGYDCTEFRKGVLEQVPVDTGTVHCITSNCVINLSPDKPAVFREMWRMLAQHARIVVADIVADRPVPPALKANEHLWGECIAGALTEAQFLAALETAGFYGVQVLRKSFWKTVEGYHFFSVTVRGYKFAKAPSCRFVGQRALYLGPGKAFVDEEGHQFPRNVAVEVCTDTAAKLRAEPYAASFSVFDSGLPPDQQVYRCDPNKGCC